MGVITKEQAQQRKSELQVKQDQQSMKTQMINNKFEFSKLRHPMPTFEEAKATYDRTFEKLSLQINKREISFQDFQKENEIAIKIFELSKDTSLINVKSNILRYALQQTKHWKENETQLGMHTKYAQMLNKEIKNEHGKPHNDLGKSISNVPKPRIKPQNIKELIEKIESLCTTLSP